MKRIETPKAESSEDAAMHPGQQTDLLAARTAPSDRRPRRDVLPPEIVEIMVPSLKVGAAAGLLGAFTGAAAGIIRSAPPVLFSLAMGGQWFALSSSYYASRQVALNALRKGEDITPTEKVKASAVAGGFAGMVGGAIRGPKNIVPGVIMFSLFGGAGQMIANAITWRPSSEPSKGFLRSKWSPVTYLSDQEYEKILREKLLRVDAEIAVVDDTIREIREAQSHPSEQLDKKDPGSSK
ncbi:hypothetical protein QBC47DRAFT_390554 [Echria macrotheca]|uniref:Uncharacterized protein n=1 Tax=Echria macrotheca TaxID=438768 RepID=A0AAJ0B4M4_9PEZI|nr:hypothetical protein QBC47DRAFT_390554 [Echria macrotheca]